MFVRSRLAAAIVLLLAGFALSACSTPPERHQFADLTYAHLQPFRLDVAAIDIVNEYRPSAQGANVEHLFPVQPATAAMQWAKDRLVAVGSNGVARFTVLQASALEVPLDRTTGLAGMFTDDQSERYDAVIEVRLDVENAQGLRSGSVTARALRSQTVAEDATLNDRERIWYELTEALMNDLNIELESNISRYLAVYLR